MNLPGRSMSEGGNSAAAAACRNGGYVNWTDSAGNTFKNEGACVSYAARGGVLVPIAAAGPFSVTYSSVGSGVFRAVITGTGLEASSLVRFSFVWPDRSVTAEFNIDPSGSVTFTQDEQCLDLDGDRMTSLTATGTPAGGNQTDYSLPLPDASICP